MTLSPKQTETLIAIGDAWPMPYILSAVVINRIEPSPLNYNSVKALDRRGFILRFTCHDADPIATRTVVHLVTLTEAGRAAYGEAKGLWTSSP